MHFRLKLAATPKPEADVKTVEGVTHSFVPFMEDSELERRSYPE
jgi:hypothetical protein